MEDLVRVNIHLWSSDKQRFTIPNNVVRTTFQNTVGDIKQHIYHQIDELEIENDESVKIIYRNQEILDQQKIESFLPLDQSNLASVPLQIEFKQANILDNINYQDESDSFDVILKSKNDFVSESFTYPVKMMNTFNDLRTKIFEHLEKSSPQLVTKHSNETDIKLFHGTKAISFSTLLQTFEEYFELDTVFPFTLTINYDIILDSKYLESLKNQYIEIRLLTSSIADTTVFTRNVFVKPTDDIKLLKQRIVDIQNSSKLPNLKTDDLRLIYRGRTLEDDFSSITDALRIELIAYRSSMSPISLHFSINLDYSQRYNLFSASDNNDEESIWEQIKNGKAFEFLPKVEEREVSEDEYYEDDINHNLHDNIFTTAKSISNGPPKIDGYENMGESFILMKKKSDKTSVLMNHEKFSSKFFKFSVTLSNGTKTEVSLSTSQVIVNTQNPQSPYIMISPSGYAQLSKLGICLQLPKISLTNHQNLNQQSTVTLNNVNLQNNLNNNEVNNVNNANNVNNNNLPFPHNLVELVLTANYMRLMQEYIGPALNIGKYLLVIGLLALEFNWTENYVAASIMMGMFLVYFLSHYNFFNMINRYLGYPDINQLMKFCCEKRVDNLSKQYIVNFINSLEENPNSEDDEIFDKQLREILMIKKQLIRTTESHMNENRDSRVKELFINLGKDILLFFITLVPNWGTKVDIIIEKELRDFRTNIHNEYEELLKEKVYTIGQESSFNAQESENIITPDQNSATGFSRSSGESLRRVGGPIIRPSIMEINNNDVESDDGATMSDRSDITMSDPINNVNSDTDAED